MPEVFGREWRISSTIDQCSISELGEFIASHYLGRRPAVVQLALVAKRDGKPFGCVVYSAPNRETSKRLGCQAWELARLYLLDEVPRNAESWLISASVRWIKRNRADVGALVSYADTAQGHLGTVYRAAGWTYDGLTDSERKSPRCDYVDSNGKKYGRKGNVPPGVKVHRVPRSRKHRYILEIAR